LIAALLHIMTNLLTGFVYIGGMRRGSHMKVKLGSIAMRGDMPKLVKEGKNEKQEGFYNCLLKI